MNQRVTLPAILLTSTLFLLHLNYPVSHASSATFALPLFQQVTLMNQTPTPPGLKLKASSTFETQDLQVRAGFHTHDFEVIAGGPLEVEFLVENTGRLPLNLAVGGDRAQLRPSFFSFQATVDETEVDLQDPSAAPNLGGPATVIEVKTNAPYRQTVLVNEFVTLENIRTALKPGEVKVLRIRCQRPIPLAVDKQQAFQTGANAQMVNVVLVVHVRRDDTALEALMAHLTAEIRADWTITASAKREQAISQLVALRDRATIPYLKTLIEHPDPAVRMRVQRALTTIK